VSKGGGAGGKRLSPAASRETVAVGPARVACTAPDAVGDEGVPESAAALTSSGESTKGQNCKPVALAAAAAEGRECVEGGSCKLSLENNTQQHTAIGEGCASRRLGSDVGAVGPALLSGAAPSAAVEAQGPTAAAQKVAADPAGGTGVPAAATGPAAEARGVPASSRTAGILYRWRRHCA